MKLTIEIRPGEGGEDAKDLVHTQSTIYQQFLIRSGFKFKAISHPG